MTADRDLELDVGSVLVPEVRVPGTITSADANVPSAAYLERFPPLGLIAFGRTPKGAVSPTPWLERTRAFVVSRGHPRPFACCDLEQGAGLHFAEGTRLPPALALSAAALGDKRGEQHGLRWLRSAGALTGGEARALGIELVLAPVADVNTRRDNPIIAVRSFGDEPAGAARRAVAWLEGLHAGGAGGCAKHFPGHGDTAQDSHLELPRVDRDAAGLREIELAPFRELIAAGVESIMIAHLDVPALTQEPGLPCTLSPRAIRDVLRGELGFRGAVLSDAMTMGALARFPDRHVRALAAGCDALLCPADATAAAEELLAAVRSGALARERVREAADSVRALHAALATRRSAPHARLDAPELAAAALVQSPAKWPWRRGAACEVSMPFPDDLSPEARGEIAKLRIEVAGGVTPKGVVIPVVCEVRAFHGGYALSREQHAELDQRVATLRQLGWPVGLLWFGSPQTVPPERWTAAQTPLLLAFAPTPPMVDAVRRWLAGEVRAGGALPARLG